MIHCDICIVTDLRFPGGNASSTLDEIDTFSAAGLRVRVVHCPSHMSQGKPTSERYQRHASLCLHSEAVERIGCDVLIVRNPTVVCSDDFVALAPKLQPRLAAFIVNNSMKRPTGEPAYDVAALLQRIHDFGAAFKALFPIGPLIRQELADLLPSAQQALLGPFDWTPTFSVSEFAFEARPQLRTPLTIGRHGRDSSEKWIEKANLLRAAYPADGGTRVLILGGADHARKVLRPLPANWEILPFGATPPADYLRQLDVFVYFPHSKLREAFGRTVVEAVFGGVPCVLSRTLEQAFGDIAFFCEPGDVSATLGRLAERNDDRLQFLGHARRFAAQSFSSASLFTRLEYLDTAAAFGPYTPASAAGRADARALAYKRWVETGTEAAPVRAGA